MRVIAHRPIDVIRMLVQDHLVLLWTNPDQISGLSDLRTAPDGVQVCFSDSSCTIPIDPGTLTKRAVFESEFPEVRKIPVVGALTMGDVGLAYANDMVLLLTEQLQFIFAVQTDAGVRNDGVTQIAGGEPGISLLTSAELREQFGRRLFKGTSLHSFKIQRRSQGSDWEDFNFSLTLPAGMVKEIRDD